MAYTLEDTNRVRELMRAAPEKAPNQRRTDKQAMVAEAIDDIEALQKRGYTLEEVAELWAKGGIEVTLPTFKSYLQRARKTRSQRRRQGAPALVAADGQGTGPRREAQHHEGRPGPVAAPEKRTGRRAPRRARIASS